MKYFYLTFAILGYLCSAANFAFGDYAYGALLLLLSTGNLYYFFTWDKILARVQQARNQAADDQKRKIDDLYGK